MDAPTGAATAAPQSPPDDADELRLVFVTLAVAHFRLGPRSSASISTTVRFSPSWFSQERCFSRPVTTTLLPRVSVSAAFSARLRQQLIVKNDVSPSVQLPAASRIRVEYATRKLATAAPFAV